MDEEDLVKKKGKKPNGSKREECEEAVELYLEVGHISSYFGFVFILNLFVGDSGGEGVCVRCELG